MMDDLQKRTAHAIVNIFETGRALGDYGKVTLLAGDSGQLTYGRSQTTLASGNLFLLIKAYCSDPTSALAPQLLGFLPSLERCDPALNHDTTFRTLLREAGDDPAMRTCQDAFFDRVYWRPAETAAASLGIVSALGGATIYDSVVHGSWKLIRDRTSERYGQPAGIGERLWITQYITTRQSWLANHSNALLHRTVYRMDALQQLANDGRWDLSLPLTVRGVLISEEILTSLPPVRISAQIVEERLLRLRTPFMEGRDIEELQHSLSRAGFLVQADGVFGPATAAALGAFQSARDLVADGIAGPATRAALSL